MYVHLDVQWLSEAPLRPGIIVSFGLVVTCRTCLADVPARNNVLTGKAGHTLLRIVWKNARGCAGSGINQAITDRTASEQIHALSPFPAPDEELYRTSSSDTISASRTIEATWRRRQRTRRWCKRIEAVCSCFAKHTLPRSLHLGPIIKCQDITRWTYVSSSVNQHQKSVRLHHWIGKRFRISPFKYKGRLLSQCGKLSIEWYVWEIRFDVQAKCKFAKLHIEHWLTN